MRFVNTKTIIPLIIVFALLFIIKNIIGSIINLNQNSQILTNLRTEEVEAKKRNQFLRERVYYVQTNEFIEKEAREKLGMVKEGEHIIIAPTVVNNSEIKVKTDIPNWEKWKNLFF